jgi:hypothetical protein
MKQLIGTTLSGLRNAIQRRIEERTLWRTQSAEVLSTVENVIDATDSRIRLISGYRKQLHRLVQNALEFTDTLVEQIPGAIEVGRRTFVADPYVNAFFVNVSDLHSIFRHSSEIRDFEDEHRLDEVPHCYALLCMRKSEKTIMGMELAGDVLRRDVQQVAVSFSDHRIYSPAPSEPETRQGLKQCLFGGLVTNALERIMQQKLVSHRLQTERQLLHTRLRHLQQTLKQADHNGRDRAALTGSVNDIERQLASIENQLMDTRPATPLESLQQVITVFSRPEEFVRLQQSSLRLDKMGIKLCEDSRQRCNRLNLTEVIIGDQLPRVVTLAKFPRDELCRPAENPAPSMFS